MLSLLHMLEVASKSYGNTCLDSISNLSLIWLPFPIHLGPQEHRPFLLTFPIWWPWRPPAQIFFKRPCLGKHRWLTACSHHPMSTEALLPPGCSQPVTGPASDGLISLVGHLELQFEASPPHPFLCCLPVWKLYQASPFLTPSIFPCNELLAHWIPLWHMSPAR